MLRGRLLPIAAFVAALMAFGRAAAQTPSEYYDQNCAACHTIGQGAVNGGPDLNDVTRRRSREWVIKFLLNPESLASDPVVIQMIKDSGGMEMPKAEGLTREMAEALLDVIEQRSISGAATPAAELPARAITAADVARGQDFFLGRTPRRRGARYRR
jgi:mono/diheme cytochrome c family protein